MSQITEIIEEKPTVLIVSEKNRQFVELLKRELKKYKADIFFSPVLPSGLSRFQYIFIINAESFPKSSVFPKHKKVSLLFLNNRQKANEALVNFKNTPLKIIHLTGDKFRENHIDTLLWFAFSQTKEKFLQLSTANSSHKQQKYRFKPNFQFPGRKKLLFYVFLLFLFLHLAFFLPLITSSYLVYEAGKSFKQENFSKTEKLTSFGKVLFAGAKKLYFMPRTTFLFFSLTFPNDIFAINEKAYLTIDKSLNLQENLREAVKIILNPEQTSEERQLLRLRLETIKNDVNAVEDSITILSQKIPSAFKSSQNFKQDLILSLDMLTRFKQILPHLDSLLAKDTEKTYLLLLANNMELRPGGGFIGSFGLLKVKDYSLKKIKIYDVYDADGQLIAHIEPPEAIRKYLGQPHWFLRDSAFSPDFLENYTQAKLFLEREMNLKNFSGSFLITTSAIQNLLGAFDNIYLPDFNEKINQKNFYLKTQYHSEKDFFPGSIQKKNFLSSLTQALLLDMENASYIKLGKEIKKSLDDKQLAVYLDDPRAQKIMDSFYWSGRTIKSSCLNQTDNCITDYLFPIDANLGLNKVNFFVIRSMNLKVTINEQGRINNTFSIQFNNDSSDVFPGGIYRNYFQLLLPKNATIKNISKDGTAVEEFSEETDLYKKIGLLLEIKPKSITELKVNYELSENLIKGKNIYQLITQKQIGAANSDFSLQIVLPKKLHLLNQNFLALVKDQQIIYNTTLSTDKIFFIELIKE